MLQSRPRLLRPRLVLGTVDKVLMETLRLPLADAFEVVLVRHTSQVVLGPSTNPDVLLVDEAVAGIHTCTRLREAAGPDLPIVVIASLASTIKDALPFLQAGATDVIPRHVLGIFPDDLPRWRPKVDLAEVRESILGRLQSLMHGAASLRGARENTRRLASAQRLARIAPWEFSPEADRFRWSAEAVSIFGLPLCAPNGSLMGLLRWVHPEDRKLVARAMRAGLPHKIEYRLVLRDGRTRTVRQEAQVVTHADGNATQMIGIAQDITELRDAERQVHELAYLDSLTNLPNRALLRRFLERALPQVTTDAQSLAVLAIDIDNFKRVSDTLGHSLGDSLLRQVATRLVEATGCPYPRKGKEDIERHLSRDAMLARVGGDDFVVVLVREESPVETAQRIEATLGRAFNLGGCEVFLSSSVGIACFPEHGTTVDELLERADAALYQAKERGPSNYRFFNAGLLQKARRRMAIENGLRNAMKRATVATKSGPMAHKPAGTAESPELYLVYQPKVEIPSHRMVGAEALMRWNSPELGVVSPGEFISVAEDAGLIVELGKWALFTACSQARSWRGPGCLNVSVNVSARQFHEPDFARTVRSILERTGLPPQYLELELTENVVMPDPATSRKVLQELKELGVNIALDDFGTGYSSLNYLAKLPIDTLKIDRSFVIALHGGEKTSMITSAIIGLARGLDIDVVVEGVETRDQLEFVTDHAPATVQGFLFAKPMPFEALATWRAPRVYAEESGMFPVPVIARAAGE